MLSMELAMFRMQAILSISLMAFCMIQLSRPPKQVNESLYSSLLFAIVGWWLPNPGSKKQSNVAIDSQTTNVVANEENIK